jgi:hypothetical protein
MVWPKMESRHTPTLSYTVPASREQGERWQAAAAVQGERSVGTWLAVTADAHLRELARSGRATPLLWSRDRFPVTITDTSRRPEVVADVEVWGVVSGSFGVFRGSGRGAGPPGCGEHSLMHLPTRRIIATLPLRKSCMALAAELAALRIDWQETDPEKVVGGALDHEKARALLRLYEKLTRT